MSDTATGVIVRLESGAEYGLKDAETAKAIYPGGVIVSYADGRPYVEEGEDDTPATVTVNGETVTFEKLTRDELNELAPSLGIEDPKAYRTKAELIEGILTYQQALADGAYDQDTEDELLDAEIASAGVETGGPDA